MNPRGTPDYFGVPNWANSPLAYLDPLTGLVTGGIRKFVDSLPGLGPANANDLGQYIPIAVPDTVTYPGSDYYQINLVQYHEKMHADLPATTLRGYVQTNNGTDPTVTNPTAANNTIAPAPVHYLGPLILARANRPVRIKFTNQLPAGAGGNLFIPTDTTVMGAGLGPDGVNMYGQNRATLHLHGGATPWVSDGTPHQWTVPVGDTSLFQKGASAADVSDMPPAGQGQLTFYWTNEQSARLMFYHDHAYGITRLDVYAGEAAGYLLTDLVEQDLITGTNVSGANAALAKVLPDLGIPLVIQDKTFVPSNTATPAYPSGQLVATDPTWDLSGWGGLGNFWFPHVYMTNQNPADPTGANPYGRWDYGPWFWPPMDPSTLKSQPSPCPTATEPTRMCPGTPNPSLTPEAFMDTPVINGTAYPYMTVQPKTYRFRILNASNDRTLNLQWYVADASAGTGATATATVNTTTGVVTGFGLTGGGSGYLFPPTVYVLGGGGKGASATTTVVGGVVTAITLVSGGTGYTVAPRVMIGSTKEVKMAPAVPHDAMTVLPPCPAGVTTGMPTAYTSGTPYSGTGCWPSTWPVDGRTGGVPDPTTVGPNMIQIGTEGGFLKAPVVIDNTPVGYEYNRRNIVVLNVSNHSLLLGPAERADVLVDFSSVPVGSKLILYNDAPAPVPGFDPRLDYYTGDPDQSDNGDPTVSTPEGATGHTGGATTTPPEYGPNTRTIMQVQVVAGTATPYGQMAALTTALASAWDASQPVHIIPQVADGGAVNTYSRIQDTSLTFTPLGSSTPQTMPMQPKTIQELFELDYGRMNATLGVELPFTNFNTQTTIPLGYRDPLTEALVDGVPQLWKVTHNGVDTHFIHFHLFNVQLINRVGWDGMVKPPDPNEQGWKDTVRMNPLEDAIVALRPTSPSLPFGVPDSVRPLDPTMPVGATLTLTNPADGNALTVTNDMTNFGWEYVWHCHILGHEENDMMRPMSLAFGSVVPSAPTHAAATISGGTVIVTWWDPTPGAASLGNPANEIGFQIMRSTNGGSSYTQIGTALANATTYVDAVAGPYTNFRYFIRAFNAAGTSTSSNVATPSAAAPLVMGSLTANVSFPAKTGAAMTWTVTTTGGVAPLQFEFWRYSTASGWVLGQVYNSLNTFTWTPSPTDMGTWWVQVWVKSAGSVSQFDAYATSSAFVVATNLAVVSVTPSVAAPAPVGGPITWSATTTGGASPLQYQFWRYSTGTGWILAQAYSTSNAYVWTPTSADAGIWYVQVWVRNTGSTNLYDGYATSAPYQVGTAPTVTSVTTTTVSPATAGTSITWTASGSGGIPPLQYQFWTYSTGTGWTLVQPYSSSNTYTAPLTAGTWYIQVWVRNSGSTNMYDGYATSSPFIVQ